MAPTLSNTFCTLRSHFFFCPLDILFLNIFSSLLASNFLFKPLPLVQYLSEGVWGQGSGGVGIVGVVVVAEPEACPADVGDLGDVQGIVVRA